MTRSDPKPQFWSTWTHFAPFVGFGMGYLFARFVLSMDGDALWLAAMLSSAVATIEGELATIRTVQMRDNHG